MLVNNNRVYSSKLACSLSPCPTLGSRWCNVTAQFQHLPSLSKTGPGVLRGPGRVRNVVVCDTLATELWEQNTAPLIPAQSCGVRWGRTSGAWCLVPATTAYSLLSVCWARHQTGMATWAALVMCFGWLKDEKQLQWLKDASSHILLLSLDWTVWTNVGVTGDPTYCTAALSSLISQKAACLKVEAPACCTAPCRAAARGSNSLVHSLLLFPRTPAG